jgi:hypothetical protein
VNGKDQDTWICIKYRSRPIPSVLVCVVEKETKEKEQVSDEMCVLAGQSSNPYKQISLERVRT